MRKTFNCERCNAVFERYIKPGRKGAVAYCSASCLFINGHPFSPVPRLRKNCGQCGREFLVTKSRTQKGRGQFCSRTCSNKHQTYERTLTTDGYYAVMVDGKRLREHRFIMEKHIGRKLLPEEDVHHVNGDKLDNRISNLIILNKSYHGALHANLNRMKAGA